METTNETPTSGVQSLANRILGRSGTHYELRLAANPEEVRRAQRLRFEVFNLELHEGLSASYDTGLDADPFDRICDHLLVEHVPTGLAVGTYRLQTGTTAASHLGYYSNQEFDLKPFESFRGQIVELGRACVHSSHRNLSVLSLLWKGIAIYCRSHGARYLLGCSSLTSQDPREGAAMYQLLASRHLAPPEWQTQPRLSHRCSLENPMDPAPRVPKLLAAYLSIGARICGPPAIDADFRTIDFLTFLDLNSLAPAIVRKYLL